MAIMEYSKPLYLKTGWKAPDTVMQRATVVLIFPIKIERGGLSASVTLGSKALEHFMKSPKSLIDLYVLHKEWRSEYFVRYERYHWGLEDLRNVRRPSMYVILTWMTHEV